MKLIYIIECRKPTAGFVINFEDPDFDDLKSFKPLYNYINSKLQPDKMNYIFLDEIGLVDEWQKCVDGLFIKKNCDVYITGSNSYMLSSELATLISGRYKIDFIRNNAFILNICQTHKFFIVGHVKNLPVIIPYLLTYRRQTSSKRCDCRKIHCKFSD